MFNDKEKLFYYKFTTSTESVDERVVKISQNLAKLQVTQSVQCKIFIQIQ